MAKVMFFLFIDIKMQLLLDEDDQKIQDFDAQFPDNVPKVQLQLDTESTNANYKFHPDPALGIYTFRIIF